MLGCLSHTEPEPGPEPPDTDDTPQSNQTNKSSKSSSSSSSSNKKKKSTGTRRATKPYTFVGRVVACSHPFIDDQDQVAFDLALLYSPLGQVIQPGMISMPGLGASVHNRSGGFVAQRGVLPSNHNGTVFLEDVHRISQKIFFF